MEMLAIRPFRAGDESAVIRLWRDCGLIRSSNDPLKDMQRKHSVQPELFLIALLDGRIVASVMAGYEGHRGWLNYLAVTPGRRQTGIGRLMVAEAEQRLRELGCPKINLQVRSANTAAMEFYRRIGFQVDEVVSMGKRLIKDQFR
jgi:ribosomal protein S18 acetylase RimI-like enzyme